MTNSETSALDQLRTVPQWVCYGTDRNHTTDKCPYHPVIGVEAEANNPQTWSTHEKATAAANKYPDKYKGIGRELVKEQHIVTADLDHCVIDGVISEYAQGILRLVNSYAEFSPGDGIHIWAYGELPNNIGPDPAVPKEAPAGTPRIELFDSGKYLTWTGRHVPGTPETLEDRHEVIAQLHADVRQARQDAKRAKTVKQERATNTTARKSADAYAQKALQEEVNNVARAGEGARNHQLNTSAYALGQLVGGGALSRATVENDLFNAATGNGLSASEAAKTIQSGIEAGMKQPRTAPEPTHTRYTPLDTTQTGSANSNGHKKQDTAPDDRKLPDFFIEGQLREQEKRAVDVLVQANQQKTRLFMYLTAVSKVDKDEHGSPMITQLERAAVRHELSCAANFWEWRKRGDEMVAEEALPPLSLAEQLLALSPSEWGLPALKAIIEAPVLRPDGSILDKPGYDERTKLYYMPSGDMKRCKIPTNPTREDAYASMNFLRPIFADFPFEGDADHANAFGCLFTPFVRHAVKKDIQMALVDATNPGTGKGLITLIVSYAATGKATSPIAAKNDDNEWRKAILTELLSGPRIVIIDNIRGVLESAAIELILTAEGFNERILGQSKNAKPKNEATWIATGNNLLIGGDLARRCYRIRLVAREANPDERDDSTFQIPDIEDWMLAHRPEVVSAILTVCRAWYLAGKPKAANVPNLGTFSDWAKTIGGILEFAGVTGFQQNRAELRSRNNEEAAEWETFLSVWYQEFGDKWIPASEVVAKIDEENSFSNQPTAKPVFDALPQGLKKAYTEKQKSFIVTLPVQLRKRVQTVYGRDCYRIENDKDDHTKNNVWRVLRWDAVGQTNYTREQKNKDKSGPDTHTYNGARQEYADPPQPTARENGKNASSGSTPTAKALLEDESKQGFAVGCKKNQKDVEKMSALFRKKYQDAQSVFWTAPKTGIANSYVTARQWYENFQHCWTSQDESVRQAAIEALEEKLATEVR